MHDRLSQHKCVCNVLAPEQFGFRKGISTENAAYKLTDSTFDLLTKKKHVWGIFCDLFQMFDCVNHEILLVKLILMAFKEQVHIGSDPNGRNKKSK